MGAFREAVDNERKWTHTWNGADALNTSSSKCLDFFGRAGSMRNASIEDKLNLFDGAFKEDADIAVKLLFYTRDIRGGYGERDTFNQIFRHLANINSTSVEKNLWAVLEFGRAKDLYSLIGTPVEEAMWQFMHKQFELDFANMEAGKSVSLLAKWMATPDANKSEKTKALGKLTAKKMGYNFKTMREYKNKLRALRKYLDLPEAKMCAGAWDEIEYSKCASKFLLKNRKAFQNHDADRYQEFISKVNSGEQKMNMGTVVPSDIIHKVYNGEYSKDLEAMWKSLPDMNKGNAMVICDTSGSMWFDWSKAGNVYPGEVAFALAIYFAERNKGDLKDLFMTFSDKPQFIELDGITLQQKFNKLYDADWNGSTNLEAAFDLLLKTCVNGKVPQDEMPDAFVIISDMQINCVNGLTRDNRMTFYDIMAKRYADAGYKMPQVVFWNVNALNPTFHASKDNAGVSLVSGFSPNIFKQVMENIGTTPYELMMAVVNNERYKDIVA